MGRRRHQGRAGPALVIRASESSRLSSKCRRARAAQDIAYRPATRSKAGPPRPEDIVPDADFFRESVPDERMPFRFSALTFNAHRTHYDLPYAQGEGYPALVVHGPLAAVLLADLVTRETDTLSLKHFSFRARSTFYLGDPILLLGKRHGRQIKLTAMNEKRVSGLTTDATLA